MSPFWHTFGDPHISEDTGITGATADNGSLVEEAIFTVPVVIDEMDRISSHFDMRIL